MHPIDPDTLTHGFQAPCVPAAPPQPGRAGAQSPPIDMHALLRRCMGDRSFAERITAKFKTRFADDLEVLAQCVQAGDALATARLAHSLKGAAATLSAHGLEAGVARLETLGRSGDLAQAPSGLAELRNEWRRFVDYLEQAASGASTPPG